MINASVRDKLEREIQRTENHLAALKDLLEEVLEEVPRRKTANEGLTSRIPLVEEALAKVRGNRVFSVKEVTALAQRIDPEVDRRLIYNCIKSYLQTSVKRGEMEQVGTAEYQRITQEEDNDTGKETLRKPQRSRPAADVSERETGTRPRRSRSER